MSLQYDDYLKEHLMNVQKGLNWMNDNLDVDRDIRSAIGEALWRNHDESKYGTKEYRAYDAYFYGGNRSYKVVQDFNYAWLHHIHNNPHHWQYWVLINDDEKDGTVALEMPKTYVAEMIADWWTFSWKTGKLGDIFEWYDGHKDRIVMHKNTRKLVEDILDKIETKLIDTCCLKENWRDEKKQSSEPDSSQVVEIDADTKEEPVENDILEHHGILGQKWGVRRFQNPDGTRTNLGKAKEHEHTVFISGSSKTQSEDSEYYRPELNKEIKDEIDRHMKAGDKIIVGDAPGVDRQVQDYLNKANYDNVEIYGPGKQVRYSANEKWKTNPIDAPEFEEGSKEWLAKKDKAMTDAADEGLAIILDEGAKATRNNVQRLIEVSKDVKVFELNKSGSDYDKWVDELNDILKHSDDDEEDEHKYGVPDLKKFPMPDAKHVKSAIRFFNYIDPKYEKELAEAILERANEYGVDISEMNIGDINRFKQYLPKDNKEN